MKVRCELWQQRACGFSRLAKSNKAFEREGNIDRMFLTYCQWWHAPYMLQLLSNNNALGCFGS